MPTEDLKTKRDDEPEGAALAGSTESAVGDAPRAEPMLGAELDESPSIVRSKDEAREDEGGVLVPTQLGTQRFVYAAYFAGGIAVAFLLSKAIGYAWLRLATYRPQIGEPHDEIVMPVAAVIGALTAIYYYRDSKTRVLAEEVASELGKVSWPAREEVVNSTFVVIVTTLLATTFFALMDRFWGFLTNLVYGA